jgi:serine/threonine-protein kinase
MLAKNLLGACVSLSLVAAACGGTKATGSSGHMGGSGTTTGSTGTTSSGMTSSGTTSSGMTSSSSGTTSTTSSGTTTSSSTSSSTSGAACGGLFQATEPWNTPCDQDPVDPASSTIIGWLAANGGWGNGNVLQIDTSIGIQCADASTPFKPYTMSGDFYSPDCDSLTGFPVPTGGAVEGENGYACTMNGDCHLLVVDHATNKLYEMYRAFAPPDPVVFNGGCSIVWDLTKAYPPNLRGDGCTSADAGGFPISAMLFTADEVAAGHIDHAIRFILPNARIRDGGTYVHPATHTGVSTSTVTRPNAPPYGVHFRLKASFDLTKLPNNGARVVAKAMQKYGMFLSDGGNIALTAADDRFTTAKWADANVNVAPKDLGAIQVTDFDVVNLGTIITTGDNCIRNP